MTPKQIMKLPYILFVLGMLDAPSIDYGSKEKEKVIIPETAQDEANALINALG